MNKFSVDFDKLVNNFPQKEKQVYRLSDVKDKIEKVAFDVVRFRDNKDTDMLWKIEDTNDGPVIIALYEEDTGSLSASASKEQVKKDWETITDKKTASLHIFYKSEPVLRIKAAEAGVPSEELDLFARWLPIKLQADESFQLEILKKMASESRDIFVKNNPEFKKIAAKI